MSLLEIIENFFKQLFAVPAKAEEIKVGSGELTKYDHYIKYYVSLNSLPAEAFYWIKAIMFIESDYGRAPSVVKGTWGDDGKSKGVMQLLPSTANDYERIDLPQANDLNKPELSIRIGTKHFARLYRKFGSNLEHAVKAYNQGEGNMAKEIASGKGYANAYWAKFQKFNQSVRRI